MSERTDAPPHLWIAGAYLFLFLLVLWPMVDFLSTALPMQWGRVEWRFGSAGLLASFLPTPTLAIVMAMVLAYFLEHRVVLQALAILCFAGSVLLVLAMISLGVDTLQLWSVSTPEGLASLKKAGLVAEAKHLAGLAVLMLLGIGAWQASRRGSMAAPGAEDVRWTPGLALRPTAAREQGPQVADSALPPDEPVSDVGTVTEEGPAPVDPAPEVGDEVDAKGEPEAGEGGRPGKKRRPSHKRADGQHGGRRGKKPSPADPAPEGSGEES